MRRRRREACHAAEGVAAMTVLETERLILRPVVAAHEEALHRLHRDALIVRALWDGRLPTRQHTRDRLAAYLADWRQAGIGFWMVYARRDGDRKSTRLNSSH